LTLLLALIAFFLPELESLPRAGLVGWLLLLAGLAEFAFGRKRGPDALGRAAVGSGLITAIAGLLFLANPLADYFPVANIVTAWLFLRGAWVLVMAFRIRSPRLGRLVALSGGTDVLLGSTLLAHLPVAILVVTLFGPTPELVARFALLLAASFAVTAICQIAIGLSEWRQSNVAGAP
jgi:uncharacterized membrane protein HdeD (DUF308 family)